MKLAFDNKTALMISAVSNEASGLMSRLRTQGLSLEHITSGFQAISHIESKVKSNTFTSDAIILFENCSDMSQRESLSLIRVIADSKKAPIIILSKNSDIDDIQEMISEGANEFLTNYSDFNLVIEKLNKLLA